MSFRSIAMPKKICGLEKMSLNEVFKFLVNVFQHLGMTIFVFASGNKKLPVLEVFDTENVY